MSKDEGYFIVSLIAVFIGVGVIFAFIKSSSKEEKRICAEAGNQILEVHGGGWVCLPASKEPK